MRTRPFPFERGKMNKQLALLNNELGVAPEVLDAEVSGTWYSSNNSGGGWWLRDEDWYALERDGWIVKWFKDDPDEKPYLDANGRWLGALATRAFLPGVSEREAIDRWEDVVNQSADAEGCRCCGAPHYFYQGFAEER